MHSTVQRLNHLVSTATTFVMILLALISVASYFTLPAVEPGSVDIRDLIVQRGRLRRPYARDEDIASLRFSISTDLTALLESYNTKQLFLYLTAAYYDGPGGGGTTAGTTPAEGHHEVVLWDRIVTRSDARDIRAVGKRVKAGGKTRGRVRVEDAKNKYPWRDPSRTFRNVESANMTLHYSLMPYVGIVSTGIAATAKGPITIPAVQQR